MKQIVISLGAAALLLLALAGIAYAATGITDPTVLRDLPTLRGDGAYPLSARDKPEGGVLSIAT